MEAIYNNGLSILIASLFSDIINGKKIDVNDYSEINSILNKKAFNILMADDDDDDFDFLNEAISAVSTNIRLTRVIDGVELINYLGDSSKDSPDMIFLDLNMPRKNGFECLEEINNFSAWSNIPVIIYSTSAYSDQLDKTFENGARFYIKKPDSFGELKKILIKLFSIDQNMFVSQTTRNQYLFK